MPTFPNQRIIKIHKEELGGQFLGINLNTMKAAARDLNAPAFKLYIYFAANKKDYTFALSPAAMMQEIGMARSTFYDQFRILEAKGYIMRQKDGSNVFHFYEKPLSETHTESVQETEGSSVRFTENVWPQFDKKSPSEDKEIYINNNKTIINSPRVEEKQGSGLMEKEKKIEGFVF